MRVILVALLMILLVIPVFAEEPLPPAGLDARIVGKVDEIATKLDVVINQTTDFRGKLFSDLNEYNLNFEAKLDTKIDEVQNTLRNKADFGTMIVALVMVSIINWVAFAILKSQGRI